MNAPVVASVALQAVKIPAWLIQLLQFGGSVHGIQSHRNSPRKIRIDAARGARFKK